MRECLFGSIYFDFFSLFQRAFRAHSPCVRHSYPFSLSLSLSLSYTIAKFLTYFGVQDDAMPHVVAAAEEMEPSREADEDDFEMVEGFFDYLSALEDKVNL